MKVTECLNRPVLMPCSLKDLNFQVDPYIGCEHYCYYCYVLPKAETDWKQEVYKHDQLAERLQADIKGIPPQKIYIGWQTDPYQPCEEMHQQTRQILEVLLAEGFSASILTKSDLVLRDLDILRQMPDASVCFSAAFDKEQDRKRFEYNTVKTQSRIQASKTLKEAGIEVLAMLCPVIPYLTDVDLLIDQLSPHARLIWVYGISILDRNDPNWKNMEIILEKHYPEIKQHIEQAVFSRSHDYWVQLKEKLLKQKNENGVNLDIHI